MALIIIKGGPLMEYRCMKQFNHHTQQKEAAYVILLWNRSTCKGICSVYH
jgi:hypothetical protein